MKNKNKLYLCAITSIFLFSIPIFQVPALCSEVCENAIINNNLNSEKTVSNKETDTEFFDNGRKKSVQNYYKNGVLAQKTEYSDNELNTKIKYIKYYENGLEELSQSYYENGKLKNEYKYHNNKEHKKAIEKIYFDNKKNSLNKFNEWNEDGTLIKAQLYRKSDGKALRDEKRSTVIDNNFNYSYQGVKQGDCYLVAAINAIVSTKFGNKTLKQLIKQSTDNNGNIIYTVKFPGAKKAFEDLDGNKGDNDINGDDKINKNLNYGHDGKIFNEIYTGTYTFTQDEFNQILNQQGTKYSFGDADVILLEAAFEKYREQVKEIRTVNGLTKGSFSTSGLKTNMGNPNILYGGSTSDAIFILTGKKCISSSLSTNNAVVNYTAQNMEIKNKVNPEEKLSDAKRQERMEIVKKLAANQGHYFACACFKNYKPSEKKGTKGSHWITIVSVDLKNGKIIFRNPKTPNATSAMSIDDFVRSSTQFTYYIE